ncbi:MAG: carbohydrate binding family 9 domain-containing protein [Phaeodactylibacter sp.]|nr:carbohydrate binding family 9 domain-containing protein [Phaeodactylibacter sp.]
MGDKGSVFAGLKRLSVVIFLLTSVLAFSQEEENGLVIRRTAQPIRLDGVLDEPVWEQADVATNFYQNFPFDTSYAELDTEVKVAFDDAALYIGAIIYQPQEDYIVTSLRRDFESGPSDEFAVNIDPFQDKINGFHFAVTPLNVHREGLIDNGNNISTDWDNKWYAQVANHPEYWVVEMAIPFKTLRYRRSEGANQWRINFSRIAVKQNEQSTWGAVPRQFDINNLAFTRTLDWAESPPSPGLNVSLIPYTIAGIERDEEFRLPAEQNLNIGGDAKVAITPSLNLDLTFNPDFSQVEVDRQLTNLSRFELFFPERRQFFLENEDLFGRFGFPSSRPFFSRRIGLAQGNLRRTTTEGDEIEVRRNFNVPILAGARLSGKLDNNWRIGLLNMQTGSVEDADLAPANYSVGVLQRKVFDRSFVGAIFTNKINYRNDGDGGYEVDGEAFNRVVGLEYNLFSKDNKWEAEAFYHRSFTNDNNVDAQAAAFYVGHYLRNWRIFVPAQYIGRNHDAEMGFIPRRGFFSTSPGITHLIFPKKEWWTKRVIAFGLSARTDFTFNQPDYQLTDRELGAGAFIDFPGQSQLRLDYTQNYTYLFFPFDPTNTGGVELAEDTEYTYPTVSLRFDSDVRKDFYYGISGTYGEYFNGDFARVRLQLNYRWQPVGILALDAMYTDIQLPDPYNDAGIWLVGPRAELSFSRSLFFSVFLQYNTQADNVNINTRLQWRFKPVSDIFLVYTDNYFSDQFLVNPRGKNRAIVLKATYWLNL